MTIKPQVARIMPQPANGPSGISLRPWREFLQEGDEPSERLFGTHLLNKIDRIKR